jgi:hypothetical protein
LRYENFVNTCKPAKGSIGISFAFWPSLSSLPGESSSSSSSSEESSSTSLPGVPGENGEKGVNATEVDFFIGVLSNPAGIGDIGKRSPEGTKA